MSTTNGEEAGPGSDHEPRSGTDATRTLVDELRSLVTIRSRVSVRDRVLPALFALLPPEVLEDKDRRFAALRQLIDDGVIHIDDPDHRAAAGPLFGFGPRRWRPLTARGPDAAAAFGCGWDAYRRRRTNGASLLDETTEALARALRGRPAPPVVPVVAAPVLIEPIDQGSTPSDRPSEREDPPDPLDSMATRDPTTPGTRDAQRTGPTPTPTPAGPAPTAGPASATATATAYEPAPIGPASGHRRRRLVLIAGGLLACAALALGATRLLTADPSPDCRLLTHRSGDLPPGADAELRAWAPAFRNAGDDLGGGGAGCADELGRLHGVVTQRVSAGDDSPAALLVAVGNDHRTVVGLFADEFAQFRERGPTGTDSRTRLGVPVRRRDRTDGTRVVEFTVGIVATEPNGPSRSVTNSSWEVWKEEGGFGGVLGAPVSQRYNDRDNGLWVQEFAGGELVTSIDLPDRPTVDLDPARTGPLPTDPTGVVLRTGDGTSWLIGGDGVRHWLPTDLAYECAITEQGASPTLRISAAAIHALPVGEEYECP